MKKLTLILISLLITSATYTQFIGGTVTFGNHESFLRKGSGIVINSNDITLSYQKGAYTMHSDLSGYQELKVNEFGIYYNIFKYQQTKDDNNIVYTFAGFSYNHYQGDKELIPDDKRTPISFEIGTYVLFKHIGTILLFDATRFEGSIGLIFKLE